MNEIATIVGVSVGILGILGGYTTLIYRIGVLTSTINKNSTLILDVRNIVVNQDERIDNVESRLLIIETQHRMNHRNESQKGMIL